MSSAAITTVVKMMESMPVDVQEEVGSSSLMLGLSD
jgi:hypothetical protein